MIRVRLVAQAGVVFGAAAVLGAGMALAAATNATEETVGTNVVALRVMDGEPVTIDSTGIGEPLATRLSEAAIWGGVAADAARSYIVRMDDDLWCVLARPSTGGTAMTCGTAEMVADGRVVLRVQDRPDDPAIFVGLVADDIRSVSVDGRAAVLGSNTFVAVGSPTADAYVLTRFSGRKVAVDMDVDGALGEIAGD